MSAPRRTQQERREGTIRKLLAAATASLVEDGYAGASVQRICARAGVSQGGLFRHFATREALMVAAAEDVAQKLLDGFQRSFDRRRTREDALELALSLVRESCRSRLNQAWYELAIAARTSPALKKALAPMAASYYAKIEALGRELLPELAMSLGPSFTTLLGTILALFDGEAVQRFVLEDPGLEQARFETMLTLTRALDLARMKAHQEVLEVPTRGRGFVDLSARVAAVVAAAGVKTGLCTVFVQHTSASLIIQENADSSVRRDLEKWIARLAPEDASAYEHDDEGIDDMPAHLRAAMTRTSEVVPVSNGRLALGTWQALYLWEHRRAPHTRSVIVHVQGA